jgi:hypothetical protein
MYVVWIDWTVRRWEAVERMPSPYLPCIFDENDIARIFLRYARVVLLAIV